MNGKGEGQRGGGEERSWGGRRWVEGEGGW